MTDKTVRPELVKTVRPELVEGLYLSQIIKKQGLDTLSPNGGLL
jgi:hypothetical protein